MINPPLRYALCISISLSLSANTPSLVESKTIIPYDVKKNNKVKKKNPSTEGLMLRDYRAE